MVYVEFYNNQKNVNIEVIVSDDGSQESHFIDIIKYFEENRFVDYSIVLHPRIVGTVKNVFSAVNVANSKFVKSISPGDALISSEIIGLWGEHLKKSGRQWSFGDVLYYRKFSDSKMHLIKKHCNPQVIDRYLKHDDESC